jgi:hypothetical protein
MSVSSACLGYHIHDLHACTAVNHQRQIDPDARSVQLIWKRMRWTLDQGQLY